VAEGANTVGFVVPVIDISGFDGDPRSRQPVVDAVTEACESVGFLTIVGHAVSQPIVDAAWNTARAFFDLPEDQKRRVMSPRVGYPYGYAPLAHETLALSLGDQTPPDLKEAYAIGPLDRPQRSPRDADEASVYSDNLWPDDSVTALRPAWEAYYCAMADLAQRLLRIFALGLRLPEHHFDSMIDRHTSAMRALNYPAVATTTLPGQLRAGAHTDYGTLTILLQEDRPGGLEVRRPDGTWDPVPAVPGGFVVNLGDAMERWTNDRWRSTLHRVVLPPPGAGPLARRQSIAFFHNANWDARIECIPTCLAPGESPSYPPIEAGPHLMAKFRSTVGAPPPV
jgi:isopenicillin N synthase-like dioxygenase